MARHREVPKCPWCGKIIAKAVHRRVSKYFFGDSFSHWDYIKHDCPNKPKRTKEERELMKKFMEQLEKKKKIS